MTGFSAAREAGARTPGVYDVKQSETRWHLRRDERIVITFLSREKAGAAWAQLSREFPESVWRVDMEWRGETR